jgi:hypothetical protein
MNDKYGAEVPHMQVPVTSPPAQYGRRLLAANIWLLFVLLLFSIFFMVGAGVGASWLLSRIREEQHKPKASPPPYPNAVQVRQWSDLGDAHNPKGFISFQTSDEAAVVHEHYRTLMRQAGWGFWDFAFEDDPDTAYFQYSPDDGPTYKVLISAQRSESRQTQVLITMTCSPCDWHGEFWPPE